MNIELAHCPVNESGGNFWSANIAVKKEVFRRIEGFDENYPMPANEDQDLYIRLKKEGSIKFAYDAKVLHPVEIYTIIKYLNQLPLRIKSWAYHTSKHRSSQYSFLSVVKTSYDSCYYQIRHLMKFLMHLK